MKQKLLIIIVFSFIVLLLYYFSLQRAISIDYDESYYSNFKVENDKVYINCNILIKNPNNAGSMIELAGMFDNDVKNGLLKKSLLTGYSTDCETTTFNLKKGDNWIEVVFIGDYAGKSQKYDRLLPEIRISEL